MPFLQSLHNEEGANNGYQKEALILFFLMIAIESLQDKVQVSYSKINEGMYLWILANFEELKGFNYNSNIEILSHLTVPNTYAYTVRLKEEKIIAEM